MIVNRKLKCKISSALWKQILLILNITLIALPCFSLGYINVDQSVIQTDYDARLDSSKNIQTLKNRNESYVSIKSNSDMEISQNTNLNIPLSLIVNNDDTSYSLAVTQESPFNENIELIMKYPDYIINSGLPSQNNDPEEVTFLINDPFLLQSFEQEFFLLENPDNSTQTFNMLFDVIVGDDVKAGKFSSIIKFFLYQEGQLVSEISVEIQITVAQYIFMEIIFYETTTPELDFGLISQNIKRVDKKMEIEIISNLGKPYRLLQKRGDEMKSSISDIDFYSKDIFFEINKENIKGSTYYDNTQSLIIQDDLIYESDNNGSSDIIPIIYSLQNFGKFKAGNYNSSLSYFLESPDGDTNIAKVNITFNFLVEIEKYFLFNVYPENNRSNLDFSAKNTLNTNKNDQILKVEVLSNTGKPYTFSHSLPNKLLNSKGNNIKYDNITYFLRNENGEAVTSEISQSLDSEKKVVFESNENGDSDIFYIKYNLLLDKTQSAGFYRSDIQYNLSDD